MESPEAGGASQCLQHAAALGQRGVVYEVLGRDALEKALRGLPKGRRKAIAETIDGLEAEPRPANAEPLVGFPGLFRIRFGDRRLIYRIDDDARTVKVALEKRGDVYKPRRMQRR